MNVGQRIKERRKELGITADDLALAIGKDRTTIFRYERGAIEKLPSTVLEPIAKALHTTPSYLIGWTDDPIDYEAWLNDIGEKVPDDAWPDITDPTERAKMFYAVKNSNINTTPSYTLSEEEKDIIDKYRALDDKGKHTVNMILRLECERLKDNK